MSAADYAKRRGCSDSYVRRLRRKGLIVECSHGMIDVEASDRSLADNLNPVRGGDRSGKDQPAAPPPPSPSSPPRDEQPSVNEAVRRERLARARLAELELGELSGQLIRRQDAMRATVTLVRQAVSRMRLMASRLRGPLAATGEPRKCEALIDAEIDLICADMQKSADLVCAGETVATDLEQAAA